MREKNYFEFHGSSIYDEGRVILENADFGNYQVIRNERYGDGTFVREVAGSSWTFLSGGQLYYFLTHTGSAQIASFCELNMSKEKCLTGEYGVYYEVVKGV